MKQQYILDSSIIISAFNKNESTHKELIGKLRLKGEIVIPVIVFTEVRAGLTEKQAKVLIPLLKEMSSVAEIDYVYALKAGEILAKYKNNGISYIDATIAAIAIEDSAIIVSLDRNFKVIKGIELLEV